MAPSRDWLEKDFYKLLGVSAGATEKEVTAAYRKLARQFHPDANPGDASAEERFKEISAAYDVVGDPARRKEYDEVRAMAAAGPAHGDPRTMRFGPGGPGMSDILGNLFGRGDDGFGAPPRPAGPQRGVDLETDLHVSFVDAVRGVTATVHLVSDVVCPDCSGSGAALGTAPRPCADCRGSGVLDDNQGFFSLSRPCPACQGRGTFVDHPCPTCHGKGVTSRPRAVKVRLPEGVKDGQQIRVKGKGGPPLRNAPAGDLYVRVHVGEHPLFRRDGAHLLITVPVTFDEAALGADVKVPTIDGDLVTIRVPPGTPNGRTFRIRSRGVTADGGRGDMLATVEVAVPATLTDEERSAIEQFRAVSTASVRDHFGGG